MIILEQKKTKKRNKEVIEHKFKTINKKGIIETCPLVSNMCMKYGKEKKKINIKT
jgi:hypothetical protein